MPYRSPARWLAPLALVGAALATIAVLSGSSSSDKGSASQRSQPSSISRTAPTTSTTTTTPRSRTYVVKPGDVLSAIAAEAGISVEDLQSLNPTVDAQTLRPGQRLKLAQ
jgi:LysM repeat protein